MDLSNIPKPALIIASLTGLGAIAGGTFAMVQSSTPPVAPIIRSTTTSAATTETKSPTTKSAPTRTQSANTPSQAQTQSNPSIDVNSGNNVTPPEEERPPVKDSIKGSGQDSIKASRVVEQCKVTMARVSDPNPPVNIRSKPDTTSPDTIVTTAKNGTYLTVVDEKNDWFKISTPEKGWIAKRLTVYGCNNKTERVNFGSNDTDTVLTDEFIGTGSHDYRLRLSKGQKVRLSAQDGPLPTIVAPNGQVLHTMSDEKTAIWSGTLSESGDYRVIFDSRFKGYKYATAIEARS